MATTLRARSSTVPIPTGQVSRVSLGPNLGVRAWPTADNYFHADTIGYVPMEVGPFTGEGTGQFYIHARAWCIQTTSGGWENAISQLRLVNGAKAPVVDATNRNNALAYHTMEGGHAGGWRQCLNETCYQVATGPYYVQFLGGGGGGASSYYVSSDHIGMVGFTVGEGVY